MRRLQALMPKPPVNRQARAPEVVRRVLFKPYWNKEAEKVAHLPLRKI
jgi:hypothetical protein